MQHFVDLYRILRLIIPQNLKNLNSNISSSYWIENSMTIRTLFEELDDLGLEPSKMKILPSDFKEVVKRDIKKGTSLTLGVRKTTNYSKNNEELEVEKREYWYFRAIYRIPDKEYPVKRNLVRLSEEQKDNEKLIDRLKELYQLESPNHKQLSVLQEFQPQITELAEEIGIPETEIIRTLLKEGLDKELIQNFPFFKELVMTFLNVYRETESPVLRDIIFQAQTVIRQRTG